MAHWSPYDNNGGTSMAVAGSDFAIVAGDTRLSTGYSIYTRSASKIFRMSAPPPRSPPLSLPRPPTSIAHLLLPVPIAPPPTSPLSSLSLSSPTFLTPPLPLTPCSPVGLFPRLSPSFLCLCCLSASLLAPFASRLPPNTSYAAPFPTNLRCTAHSPSPGTPTPLALRLPFSSPNHPHPSRAPVPPARIGVCCSDRCVLVSSGFQADRRMLQKVLHQRHEVYQQQHNEEMGCEAMAQLLANTLYYKRFFPYYTFNALAGLDVNGVGCVYGYDAVGSHERLGYVVHGTGQQLVVPVLDSQLKAANPLVLPPQPLATKLSQEEAVDLIKDTFASAAERDIYTGDALEIVVIDKNGVRREIMDLRKD
ncbi:unnamed protein product [Closterium sp. Yama58-4]|nr:unnamed protein product [Closterium sp. Yama58-4]